MVSWRVSYRSEDIFLRGLDAHFQVVLPQGLEASADSLWCRCARRCGTVWLLENISQLFHLLTATEGTRIRQ